MKNIEKILKEIIKLIEEDSLHSKNKTKQLGYNNSIVIITNYMQSKLKKKDYCIYSHINYSENNILNEYKTTCSSSVTIRYTPRQKGWKYCPKCGKKIKEYRGSKL